MRQRGFTLLEVLVASAIFALLAMATYRMLEAVLGSDQQLQVQQERLRELTRAISVFERDVLQARSRPVRDPLGGFLAAMSGDSGRVTHLELTRSGWRNPLGQHRSSLQRVRWQIDNGQLRRGYWSVLDQAPDSRPQWQSVLSDVQAFHVRWLDDEERWLEHWPPATGNSEEALTQLPKAVEMVLEHNHYGEIRRVWRLPEMPQQEALFSHNAEHEQLLPAATEGGS